MLVALNERMLGVPVLDEPEVLTVVRRPVADKEDAVIEVCTVAAIVFKDAIFVTLQPNWLSNFVR